MPLNDGFTVQLRKIPTRQINSDLTYISSSASKEMLRPKLSIKKNCFSGTWSCYFLQYNVTMIL